MPFHTSDPMTPCIFPNYRSENYSAIMLSVTECTQLKMLCNGGRNHRTVSIRALHTEYNDTGDSSVYNQLIEARHYHGNVTYSPGNITWLKH